MPHTLTLLALFILTLVAASDGAMSREDVDREDRRMRKILKRNPDDFFALRERGFLAFNPPVSDHGAALKHLCRASAVVMKKSAAGEFASGGPSERVAKEAFNTLLSRFEIMVFSADGQGPLTDDDKAKRCPPGLDMDEALDAIIHFADGANGADSKELAVPFAVAQMHVRYGAHLSRTLRGGHFNQRARDRMALGEKLLARELGPGFFDMHDPPGLSDTARAYFRRTTEMIAEARVYLAHVRYIRDESQEAARESIELIKWQAKHNPSHDRSASALEIMRFGGDPNEEGFGDVDAGNPADPAYLAYVKEEFDGYAASYDTSRGQVDYFNNLMAKIKEMITDHAIPAATAAIAAAAAAKKALPFGLYLDLGVGTGLVGEMVKPHCSGPMMGVDISPRMLERTRAKGIYTSLHEAEVVTWLRDEFTESNKKATLVSASEIMIYFSALDTIFGLISEALEPGTGLFIASFEALEAVAPAGSEQIATGHALRPSGRQAHTLRYIDDTAEAAGMEVLHVMGNMTLRIEYGKPELGHVVLFRSRRGGGASTTSKKKMNNNNNNNNKSLGKNGDNAAPTKATTKASTAAAAAAAAAGSSTKSSRDDETAALALAKQAKSLIKNPAKARLTPDKANAKALALFEDAIALYPKGASLHNDLGVALLRIGRGADAEAQFEESLALRKAEMARLERQISRTEQNIQAARKMARGSEL